MEEKKITFENLFDRDSRTFVKARTEDRLNWETSLDADDAYSKYLVGETVGDTPAELLKKAYDISKGIINAVTAEVDMKDSVNIHYTQESFNNMTDGSNILVSTKVLEDKDLEAEERLDVVIGEAVHEALHVKHTDFVPISAIKKKMVHAISNILEDERIEMLCGEETPGYSRFLEKIKNYFFDKLYKEKVPDFSSMNEGERLLTIFSNLVRYPKYLEDKDLEEYAEYLEEIKKELSPFPETTEEVAISASNIFSIIKKFYDDKEEDSEEGGEGKSEKEDIEKACSKMVDEMEKTFSSSVEEESSKLTEKAKSLSDEDIEGAMKHTYSEYEKGEDSDTYFIKAEVNERKYNNSYAKINRFSSALSRIIKFESKDSDFALKSMRSGRLDTTKLVEAVQGVDTVYERWGSIKSEKMAVCLLVDESGSMSGSKIDAARDCAVLFFEALHRNKDVELFVYGHTADTITGRSTDINVYYEPGYRKKYSLGSIQARSQNRDGVAIYETGKRVRKFTNRPCVMFVMSDGAPCAYSYSGYKHTKDMVNKLESMYNFTVIQVAIEGYLESDKMFTHFVKLTDIAKLPLSLGLLMKSVIKKMMKASTTYI